MRAWLIASIFTSTVGCFGMVGGPGMTGSSTGTASPPMPMNNEQAMAYAQAHRDPTMGVLHANNNLAVPICRVELLRPGVGGRDPINVSGTGDEPAEKPFLAPGENGLMTFRIAANPQSMAVTAYGCARVYSEEKHRSMYMVDEGVVVFEKTVPVKDQGTLAFVN